MYKNKSKRKKDSARSTVKNKRKIKQKLRNQPGFIHMINNTDKAIINHTYPRQIVHKLNLSRVLKSTTGGYYIQRSSILHELTNRIIPKPCGVNFFDLPPKIYDPFYEPPAFTKQDGGVIKKIFGMRSIVQRKVKKKTLSIYQEEVKYIEFPKKHLLNRIGTPNVDIIHGIFGMAASNTVSICSDDLIPIIEQFAIAHCKFKYYYILKSVAAKGVHKYQIDITKDRLHAFFSIVLHKVVPRQLFGSSWNLKRVSKAVFRYVDSPIRKVFLVPDVALELKTVDIPWLNMLTTIKRKYNVLCMFLKWFFKQYINVIMKTYIYEAIVGHNTERIFVPKNEYLKRRDKFIANLKADGVLQEDPCDSCTKGPIATLILHLKPEAMRPIYARITLPDQAETIIDYLKPVLRQTWFLKNKDCHLNDLYCIWDEIATNVKKNKTSLYYITCDVKDAYGSVRQDKLIEILDDLLRTLPKMVIFKKYITLDRFTGYLSEFYQVHDRSIPVLLAKKSLNSSMRKKNNVLIPLKVLKNKLKNYILNQRVIVGTDVYRLAQGVGQGLPLSAILANIYYGTMELEMMSEFQKEGTLIRFVDDFLYTTTNQHSAEKFLALVNKGIPEYNCSFKVAKTHTNLEPQCESTFSFLGFHFNAETLEVLPKYSELPSQYNMTCHPVKSHKEKRLFQLRALNLKSLKLNNLVFASGINSLRRAERTLITATLRQARRIRILIIHMLSPNFPHSNFIFITIRRVIKNLFQKFMHARPKFTNVQRLRLIMWKKFLVEFQKDGTLPKTLLQRMHEKVGSLRRARKP